MHPLRLVGRIREARLGALLALIICFKLLPGARVIRGNICFGMTASSFDGVRKS